MEKMTRHAFKGIAAVLSATLAVAAYAAQTETPYTTVSRHSAGGQLLGTIAPDPDGTGPLRYAATRYTYGTGESDKTLLLKVESGELNAWANENVKPENWSGFTAFVTTHYTYDSHGRKVTTRIVGTDGQVESLVQYNYDSRNRILCKAVRMNPLAYGSLPDACVLGPQGEHGPDRITRYTYDILDQVLKEERAVGTPIQQDYVTNTYDHRRLISQTDANGNRTELRYDAHSRLIKRVYPSPNGPGAVNEADYNEYGYDANDNVTHERKRDGRSITNTYDANNRLIFKDLSDNTHSQDISYNYDLRGLTLSSKFGSDSGQGITNTFDGFGRLISATTSVGGTSRTLSYLYDANGNRTRVTHPDGWFFEYGFDGLDRFASLNESANSVPTASTVPMLSVDYHPGGGRHHLYRPSGATTEYLQDNLKRLESFSQNFYGDEHDLVASFDYNPASQVIFRARSNDLYAITGTPSRAGVYQPNGLNQYTAVGGKALGYDGNGNLTSYRDANDELVTYGYDMENRLVSATGTVGGQSVTASLTWDPLGRLHQVTINGVPRQFLYDGDALVAEYSGSTLVRRYVHGDQVDEPLVQYDSGAVGAQWRRYLHADHQGSVIAQSGHTGMVYSTNAYDPYGIPAATNSGRFGYTGQAWLPELGLYHYKARVYHPRIGRFLQTDPIFYADDMNIYVYVGNDPPNRTDPTGRYKCGSSLSARECKTVERAEKRAVAGLNTASKRLRSTANKLANGSKLNGRDRRTIARAERTRGAGAGSESGLRDLADKADQLATEIASDNAVIENGVASGPGNLAFYGGNTSMPGLQNTIFVTPHFYTANGGTRGRALIHEETHRTLKFSDHAVTGNVSNKAYGWSGINSLMQQNPGAAITNVDSLIYNYVNGP